MQTVEYSKINKEVLINNNNKEICILKNGVDYYFKLNLKADYDKVVVFSNGAADRNKSELPIFMRHSWANEVKASCIYLDDRTIHGSSLMIGWGIGREKVHHLDEVGMIVRKFLNRLDIKHSDTYYYGSSAGGTMSMILAIKHKYSNAIVNNPQMITSNYLHGKPLNYIKNYFFKSYTQEEFMENFKDRLSVPYLMNIENYVPKTLYILNKLSKIDYEEQFLPFSEEIESYDINNSKIEYILYNNKGLGHNPLPKEKTIRLINATLDGILL